MAERINGLINKGIFSNTLPLWKETKKKKNPANFTKLIFLLLCLLQKDSTALPPFMNSFIPYALSLLLTSSSVASVQLLLCNWPKGH